MTLLKELGFLSLATRIKTLGEILLADGTQIYAGLGVNFQPRWFSVFYLLQEHRELTITDVAARIGLSHPAIIKIVESMQEAGLLESNRNSQDARKRMITLSAKGEALIPELRPIWKALEIELTELFQSLGIDILSVLDTIEQVFIEKPISRRVHERYRRNAPPLIEMHSLNQRLAPAFKTLNEEWLNEYFTVEAEDQQLLDHPERIVEGGGAIYFACDHGEAVGSFALLRKEETVFELAKLAVERRHRNRGIGKILIHFAIQEAKKLGARTLILHSSTKLEAANHLYQKFGFVEDRPSAHSLIYQRPSRRYVLDLEGC